MFYCTCAVLVLSLFLTTPVSAKSDVGLAMSGPLLNQTYSVTPGQTVQGYLRLENTGGSDCLFGFASEIISGPAGSVNVLSPNPSPLQSPESVIQANWTFEIQSNASDMITVRISATASGTNQNGSTATASVAGHVFFLVDNTTYSILTRVIDQYGWPVENAEVELAKGFVSYIKQLTNQNGTTKFILAHGLYSIRLLLGGILHKSATLNVTTDRLFTFTIHRTVVRLEEPLTIPLAEIGAGLVLGYFIRLFEKRRRKPKPVVHEWLEWAEGDLS